MKKKISVFVCFLVAMTLVSCYNTHIIYGNVQMEEPLVEVNRIGWIHGFIFGLVPGNNSTIDPTILAGNSDNFVVKTNTSFLNGLVSGLTYGIYTPTQAVIYVPLRDISHEDNQVTQEDNRIFQEGNQ